jgi:hypothetical protein
MTSKNTDENTLALYNEGQGESWICDRCGKLHIHRMMDGSLTRVDDWCECARDEFFLAR